VEKTKLSGPQGGLFSDTWTCGSGWVATAVTWKITPSGSLGTSDVIVWPVDVRVNPSGTNPAEFRFSANSSPTGNTGAQVEATVRATCMSNVASDGVTTS
jgi:hypothetical protein